MDGKDLASLLNPFPDTVPGYLPLQALGIGSKMAPGSVGWNALSVGPEEDLGLQATPFSWRTLQHPGQAPHRQFEVQPYLGFLP